MWSANGQLVDAGTAAGSAGNVIGPGGSAISEIASFANTTGTLLRQGAAQATDNRVGGITVEGAALSGVSQLSSNATALYIWRCAIQTCNGGAVGNYDAMRGVALAPSGTSVNLVDGVSGYVLNRNSAGGQPFPVAVALNAIAISAVNGAHTWLLNGIATDNEGQTVSAGTDRTLYSELDYNVTSPSTQISGLRLAGTSLSQPAAANGFSVSSLGTGILWSNAFITDDGVATNFLTAGANSATASDADGQILALNYRAGGVEKNLTMTAQHAGTLTLGGTDSTNLLLANGAIFLPSNQGIEINLHTIVSGDGTSNAFLCSDAAWTHCSIGASGATVAVSGGTGTLETGVALFTEATPTVAAGQIGFGTTLTANTSCGGAGTGCLEFNIGGTPRHIQYF